MHEVQPQQIKHRADWQLELADAITSASELLHQLGLDHLDEAVSRASGFPMLVPRAFVSKMQKGNADDPLLKQILPVALEHDPRGYTDPLGELNAMTAPGLLHKYQRRVLLLTTGACAVHCRYCFRRHFPYANAKPRRSAWQQAVEYLSRHADIDEVILSGGDPLILDNERLGQLFAALEPVPHLKWLRIHTRLPVVLPSRIDDELTASLSELRFRTMVVIHANHANELATAEADALRRLATRGITLLNQSVLLRGINDSAAALTALSKRLYENGVLPYYLHMLDPVQGAMHFEVPQQRAVRILNEMKAALPGYLVPRLVREVEGEASKTAIFTI